MIGATRLRIGELARQTGVAVGTLRYYEGIGLLYPVERGDNSYRYYSPDAVQQVQFIKKAQALRFSLEEIRQILNVRDRGEPPCTLVQTLLDDKIEQLQAQIEQMKTFQAELEEYRDRWADTANLKLGDQEICPLIATVPLAV